jgi:hypothetical protein
MIRLLPGAVLAALICLYGSAIAEEVKGYALASRIRSADRFPTYLWHGTATLRRPPR